MKLSELLKGIPDAELVGDTDVEITRIEYDSRQVEPGSLFVAIKGCQRDGYDFVKQAVANGAVAVLGARQSCDGIDTHVQVPNDREALAAVAARFYDYPGLKIKVCGVTGTNGKTTVCHFIRSILQARNKTTGLITSESYETGKDTFPAERTTPESLDLQRLLFLMKKNFCVNAVVEVSSHALMLHRVDHINFRVAVFTNLTRDHLDFHKTMEEYLDAKARLLDRLDGPLSYAVINLDVPEFRKLFGDTSIPHISYSLSDTTADVYCAESELERGRTTFNLITPMGTRTVVIGLPGQFNLINAIAAASGGLACGVDLDTVVRGLEQTQPVPGRLSFVDAGQPFGVYIDYAHTPDAIKRLCETARELTEGRLLILFGCGGDRDKGKRPLMGQAATSKADSVIITTDNPRSESPEAIIEDIKLGLTGDNYSILLDREEAINTIIGMAKDGDTVLLAGKGNENYQEINGQRSDFSDLEVARKALAEQGFNRIDECREM